MAASAKIAGPFALGTFSAPGQAAFPGVVAGGRVRNLAADGDFAAFAAGGLLSTRSLLEHWDEALPRLLETAETAESGADGADGWQSLDSLRTHAPVEPRQIFQAGANYHTHVIDLAAGRRSRCGRKPRP